MFNQFSINLNENRLVFMGAETLTAAIKIEAYEKVDGVKPALASLKNTIGDSFENMSKNHLITILDDKSDKYTGNTKKIRQTFAVQAALHLLGIGDDSFQVDGLHGSQTTDYLRLYQIKANHENSVNLPKDGQKDPATLAKLIVDLTDGVTYTVAKEEKPKRRNFINPETKRTPDGVASKFIYRFTTTVEDLYITGEDETKSTDTKQRTDPRRIRAKVVEGNYVITYLGKEVGKIPTEGINTIKGLQDAVDKKGVDIHNKIEAVILSATKAREQREQEVDALTKFLPTYVYDLDVGNGTHFKLLTKLADDGESIDLFYIDKVILSGIPKSKNSTNSLNSYLALKKDEILREINKQFNGEPDKSAENNATNILRLNKIQESLTIVKPAIDAFNERLVTDKTTKHLKVYFDDNQVLYIKYKGEHYQTTKLSLEQLVAEEKKPEAIQHAFEVNSINIRTKIRALYEINRKSEKLSVNGKGMDLTFKSDPTASKPKIEVRYINGKAFSDVLTSFDSKFTAGTMEQYVAQIDQQINKHNKKIRNLILCDLFNDEEFRIGKNTYEVRLEGGYFQVFCVEIPSNKKRLFGIYPNTKGALQRLRNGAMDLTKK